jgi:hypothetical protein
MSTRGVYGFYKNGQHKVTYNHSDSYPTWLGNKILKYLKKYPVEKINKHFDRIKMVNMNSKPTKAQIERCRTLDLYDKSVDNEQGTNWYCLLRNAQGNIENSVKAGLMIDSQSFMQDSLFCEWAYIINLDTNKLEIYKGFQKSKPNGRYSNIEPTGNYYAVGLVKEYSLKRLPKEFTKKIENSF